METIKSYTDLEQSKKLAEILPIESADMWWSRCTITDFGDGILKVSYAVEPCNISQFKNTKEDVPCWSLAALIEMLPLIEGFKPVIDLDINQIRYEGKYRDELIINSENLIDACYEMIMCLHELKML